MIQRVQPLVARGTLDQLGLLLSQVSVGAVYYVPQGLGQRPPELLDLLRFLLVVAEVLLSLLVEVQLPQERRCVEGVISSTHLHVF